MEFRELKTFHVVARLLSFNKAARVLHYAQSTVSSQIQSLENSLGETLFNRTGNKICLTPAGVMLLKYTQRLINIESEILSNFKDLNETSGNLIITTPHSVAAYYLPPVIKEFQQKYPNICFEFDSCVGYNFNDIFNAGLVDVAFLFNSNFSDKHLHVEELTKVNLVFVANPKDNTFDGVIESIDDFHDKTLLLSKSDCSYRMIFEKMLMRADVKLRKIQEVNSPEATKRILEQGYKGVALLPEITVQDQLVKGTLKCIQWNGQPFNAKLFMIWKKEKFQTEATKVFVQAVRKHFNKPCNPYN